MRSPSTSRRPHRRGAALLGGAASTAMAVGGCGSSPVTQISGAPTPVPVAAPLATSFATPDGSWALVAMGQPDKPLDTFWEAFHLSAGAQRWTARTPPDVADNGGLVAATTGSELVIGFPPSQNLHFSPLAVTTDGGTTYLPQLLPDALSAVPDALSVTPDGQAVALSDDRILTSTGGLSSWRPLASASTFRRSPAARRCGIEALTAVATVDGAVVVGAACSRAGTVGLFRQAGSTFVPVGPPLPEAFANDHVQVVRLSSHLHGVAALLGLTDGASRTYVAAWSTGTGRWSLSGPAPAVGSLTSTSVTAAGGYGVLTQASDGTVAAADIARGSTGWTPLPDPPARTATIVVSGVRVDALAVDVTSFRDYELLHGRWIRSQSVTVPVPFGSSN